MVKYSRQKQTRRLLRSVTTRIGAFIYRVMKCCMKNITMKYTWQCNDGRMKKRWMDCSLIIFIFTARMIIQEYHLNGIKKRFALSGMIAVFIHIVMRKDSEKVIIKSCV